MKIDDRDEMPVIIGSGSALGRNFTPADGGIADIVIADDGGSEVDPDALLFDCLLAKAREGSA